MKTYQKELVTSTAFTRENISGKLPEGASDGDRIDCEVGGKVISVVFSTDPEVVLEAYLEALDTPVINVDPLYIGIEAPASRGVEALDYQAGIIVVNPSTWVTIRKGNPLNLGEANKLNGVQLTVTDGIQFVAPSNTFVMQEVEDGYWIGVIKPESIIKITTV